MRTASWSVMRGVPWMAMGCEKPLPDWFIHTVTEPSSMKMRSAAPSPSTSPRRTCSGR